MAPRATAPGGSSRSGGAWYWTDRLGWGYERWRQRLARDAVETWVLYVHSLMP